MLAVLLQVIQAFGKLLDDNFNFKLSQPHTETDMRPSLPECNVAIWPSCQVDVVRILESSVVSITRDEPEYDLVAFANMFAVLFEVASSYSPKMHRW